jgi:hypothetical protein
MGWLAWNRNAIMQCVAAIAKAQRARRDGYAAIGMARRVTSRPAVTALRRVAGTACEEHQTMGCLPVPLFFLLGFGLGLAIDGQRGALWGAGIGLALGLAGMGWLVMLLRRRR